MGFEQRLKEYAKEIGIDAIGITTAEPFLEAKERLLKMQELGYLSPWAEQDIEKRVNPRRVMEDAESLIAIGVALPPSGYSARALGTPETTQFTKDIDDLHTTKIPRTLLGRGRLARFAQFQDYHQVLQGFMKQLVEFIRQEYPEVEAQVYVDTGPLIDREVAYRAGLGFIGKNSALIHPELGSHLALGEILLNLPLTPDTPLENGCGECTKCLDACPQQAIKAPGEIAAQQCLAHFTQEKGVLDEEIQRKLGTRLWGCDTCQEVCPYNQKGGKGGVNIHWQEHGLGSLPELEHVLKLTNREYQDLVGGSAMAWRGKTTLQRNALINLANQGTQEVQPILTEALRDQRPVIRATAVSGLGRIGGVEVESILREALKNEQDALVVQELQRVLAKIE